jgi:hypothetical protein
VSAGTSREAFEVAHSHLSTASLRRNGGVDGCYTTAATAFAWAMWQASRKQAMADSAQVCADVCTPNLNSFGDGYNQGAIDCEKAIKELLK